MLIYFITESRKYLKGNPEISLKLKPYRINTILQFSEKTRKQEENNNNKSK
jgi:hypothetical protein